MLKKLPPETFYARMAEAYRKETGLDPAAASDIGIRMRALSEELSFLSGELEAAWLNAFPQTATGEALGLHSQRAGVSRKKALPAGGKLRFFRGTPAAADIAIPEGIICAAREGIRFKTTTPGKIKQGETAAELPAIAIEAGERGNVPPGAVNAIITGLAGVAGVTNPLPLRGGEEEEPDGPLRERLMKRLADPPAFANGAWYRERALARPGVRSVRLLPGRRGEGSLDIVIAARAGYHPETLAAELLRELEESGAAGVSLKVLPAAKTVCEPAAEVLFAGGDRSGVPGACEEALASYVAGLEIGEPVRVAGLTACLMAVKGVENLKITAPASDIIIPEDAVAAISSAEIAEVARL